MGNVIVEFVAELLLIVNWPLNEPVDTGTNVTLIVADWPGFKVNGKLIGDIANPVPVTPADFTVTAAPPLDVTVTACVALAFKNTAPNEMFVASTLSIAAAGFS